MIFRPSIQYLFGINTLIVADIFMSMFGQVLHCRQMMNYNGKVLSNFAKRTFNQQIQSLPNGDILSIAALRSRKEIHIAGRISFWNQGCLIPYYRHGTVRRECYFWQERFGAKSDLQLKTSLASHWGPRFVFILDQITSQLPWIFPNELNRTIFWYFFQIQKKTQFWTCLGTRRFFQFIDV